MHDESGRALGMARRVLKGLGREMVSVSAAVPQPSAAAESVARIVVGLRTVAQLLESVGQKVRAEQDRAETDPLTGLLNREGLLSATIAILGEGNQRAVLMADVDFFKRVNDTYGHPTGDDVLRAVAGRCKRALRDDDLLARFGGEEFIGVLPLGTREAGLAVAERIRRALSGRPVSTRSGPVSVTLSVGVAAGCETLTSLIARADQALYAAKRAGRDRVVAEEMALV